LTNWDSAHSWRCLFESFYVADVCGANSQSKPQTVYVGFSQKATANPTRVALVAPRKARNSLSGAFLLLAFILRLLHQKKSGKRLKICFC